MELPADYVTPLLPVLGILNAAADKQVSQRLISRITADNYIEPIKLTAVSTLILALRPWPSMASYGIALSRSETNNSPNNVNSPLYPDGIMSPLWIQKVKSNPGVVLGIYDLDFVNSKHDPLGASASDFNYREKDAALANILNEKRKSQSGMVERGRKFIPVLILSGFNQVLNSILEDRIAFIKKSCGSEKIFTIDSNSIGEEEEIKKFIKGLGKYLLDSLFFYYKECEKHIKKKKSKIGAITRKPTGLQQANVQKSYSELVPQGWLVRYDFKLAIFAEFRQDSEYTQRYLDSAYQNLAGMLKSSAHSSDRLPIIPFSGRWFESRLLLDCINFKLCKSFINGGSVVPCNLQFSTHIATAKHFPEFGLSTLTNKDVATTRFEIKKLGVLPGGGSFEYWAWLASHFQMFANILEQAETNNKFQLPIPAIGSIPISISGLSSLQIAASTAAAMGTVAPGTIGGSLFGPYSGINVAIFTQKPGFYLWIAAICSLERAKRFAVAQKSYEENSALFLSQYSNLQANMLKQSIHAERSINHQSVSLELLERVHTWFADANYSRLTLYLELEMAKLHENMKCFDRAIHFYNNVANIYRIEKWPVLLKYVLISLVESARKGKQSNVVVCTLFEILSKQLKPDQDSEVIKLFEELFQIIYPMKVPSADVPRRTVMIETDQTPTFLESFAQMYQSQVIVLDPIKFQLSIHTSMTSLSAFQVKLARIYVEFSKSDYNFTILQDDKANQKTAAINSSGVLNSNKIAFCQLASAERKSVPRIDNPDEYQNSLAYLANLTIPPETGVILEGNLISDTPGEIAMTRVVCIFESPSWTVGLIFPKKNLSQHIDQQRWFSLADNHNNYFSHLERQIPPTSIRVNRRQPLLDFDFNHGEVGLLHEDFPISISLRNNDENDVYVILEVSVKSSTPEIDHDTHLSLSSGNSENFGKYCQHIKYTIGLTPKKTSASNDIFLKGFGIEGTRTIVITAFWCLNGDRDNTDLLFKHQEVIEIPFTSPFQASFEIRQIPRTVIDSLDAVGHFKPNALNFLKRQSWLIASKFQNNSTSRLTIKTIDISLKLCTHPESLESRCFSEKHTKMVELSPLEAITCIHEVTLNYSVSEISSKYFIGDIKVNWKRNDSENSVKWIQSEFLVPETLLFTKPIVICINVKKDPQIGALLPVEIVIQNTSLKVEDIVISVDSAEGFVFSGPRSSPMRVLPLASRIIKLNLVPLQGGKCQLPTIKVLSNDAEKDVEFVGRDTDQVGLSLFVKPMNLF